MRRFPALLAGGLALLAASAATMAAELPFDQKTFDELRKTGNPSVIHVYATWCGTCKVQAGIVTPLLAEPEFASLTLLKADFDKEKSLIQALGVSDRSTFVAFKGATEVGRSVADMNKESIAHLFRQPLE
jgi:thioredoxin 1